MDNDPQNIPPMQDNPTEPVPAMPLDAHQAQFQPVEPIASTFLPTETAPAMSVEPIQPQFQPNGPNPEKPAKKSKKMLIIVTIIIVLLIGGAVGAYFMLQPKTQNQSAKPVNITEPDTIDDSDKKTDKIVYDNFKLGVTFEVADSLKVQEIGYAGIFESKDYYIIFSTDAKPMDMPLLNIVNTYTERLSNTADTVSDLGKIQRIIVTSSKEMDINGFNTLRIEGSFHNFKYGSKLETDSFAVGYTFLVKGVPCMLIGSVDTKEQSQSDIDSLTRDVDAMMNTIAVK